MRANRCYGQSNSTGTFAVGKPLDYSVRQEKFLRLAMLGMIPGNGHPYSWSAIVNGYDPVERSRCSWPVIPRYLGVRPLESVGISGASVTHIGTDEPGDAEKVARAA
jgi:hypothetical protein